MNRGPHQSNHRAGNLRLSAVLPAFIVASACNGYSHETNVDDVGLEATRATIPSYCKGYYPNSAPEASAIKTNEAPSPCEIQIAESKTSHYKDYTHSDGVNQTSHERHYSICRNMKSPNPDFFAQQKGENCRPCEEGTCGDTYDEAWSEVATEAVQTIYSALEEGEAGGRKFCAIAVFTHPEAYHDMNVPAISVTHESQDCDTKKCTEAYHEALWMWRKKAYDSRPKSNVFDRRPVVDPFVWPGYGFFQRVSVSILHSCR